MALVLTVTVGAFDCVSSPSIFNRWNVMADVSGIGNVIGCVTALYEIEKNKMNRTLGKVKTIGKINRDNKYLKCSELHLIISGYTLIDG